jgi:hypothetical protein
MDQGTPLSLQLRVLPPSCAHLLIVFFIWQQLWHFALVAARACNFETSVPHTMKHTVSDVQVRVHKKQRIDDVTKAFKSDSILNCIVSFLLPQPVVTANVQYVQVPLPTRRWNTVALWQYNYRSSHDKLKICGSVARVVLAGIWHKTSGHKVELTTDGSAFEICDSQFSSLRRQKPPQLQKDGRLTYFSHYGRLRMGGQLVEEIQWSNGTMWRRQ